MSVFTKCFFIYIKFLQYASVAEGEEKFMTYSDFIQKYLGLLDPSNYNEYTLQLFGSSVDTSRDKYVKALGSFNKHVT